MWRDNEYGGEALGLGCTLRRDAPEGEAAAPRRASRSRRGGSRAAAGASTAHGAHGAAAQSGDRLWADSGREQKEGAEDDEEEEWGLHDEDVVAEQAEAEDAMTKLLNSMLLGGGIALVGSIPITYLCNNASFSTVATQGGWAALFFSPIVVLWCRANRHSDEGSGTRVVVRHLPQYILALTLFNMGFSVSTLLYQLIALGHYPLGGIVSKAAIVKLRSEDALHYLTGCRIALLATSAALLGVFTNRYAAIQRGKRLKPGTNAMVVKAHKLLIDVCQVTGNVVAVMMLWTALTDGIGNASVAPSWLQMSKLAYMFGLQAHLNAPSDDHHRGAVSNMARSALTGIHAIVLVPNATTEVQAMALNMLDDSSYAAWFGTFDQEWRPAEVRRKVLLHGVEKDPELPPMKVWCCCCGFEVGGPEAPTEDDDGDDDKGDGADVGDHVRRRSVAI